MNMFQDDADGDGGFRRIVTLLGLAAWAIFVALWNRLQRRRGRSPEVRHERAAPVPPRRDAPVPKRPPRKRDEPMARPAPPVPASVPPRPAVRSLEERLFRRHVRPEVKLVLAAEILGAPKALRLRRRRAP